MPDLHVLSVLVVIALVALIAGVILIALGTRDEASRGLIYWGAGYLVGAGWVVMFYHRGTWSEFVTIDLANAVLIISYTLYWLGARRYAGRPVRMEILAVGAIIWLIACNVDSFHARVGARVVLSSAILGTCLVLTALEFYNSDAPRLERRIFIAVLGLAALSFYIRIPWVMIAKTITEQSVVQSNSILFPSLMSLVHVVVSTILLPSITRDRAYRLKGQAGLHAGGGVRS